jgi:hypothetical protein
MFWLLNRGLFFHSEVKVIHHTLLSTLLLQQQQQQKAAPTQNM